MESYHESHKKILELSGISKRFGKDYVLRDVNLSFNLGETCAVIGENGAGKSTLMKIISGIYAPDDGEVFFNGERVKNFSPHSMAGMGIGFVMQEPQFVPSLSIEQNIFLGRELCHKNTRFVDSGRHIKVISDLFEEMNLKVSPYEKVNSLSFTQMKYVELAKALITNPSVLILDEFTDPFTNREIDGVMDFINKLSAQGKAIIFVTHKLDELQKISKRVVILRDGSVVADIPDIKTATFDYLVDTMTGVTYTNRYPKTKSKKGGVLFRAEGISNEQKTVKDASLYIRAGETVGLAGLQGAGKSSFAKLVTGAEPLLSGKIYMNNKLQKFRHPYQAFRDGIAYLSGNNLENLFMDKDSYFNISAPNLDSSVRLGFLSTAGLRKRSAEYLKKLTLRKIDLSLPVNYLSRGMQQKIAFSKILFTRRKLLILDDPSTGLDIPSKLELYNLMNLLVHQQHGILLISSDIEELLGMCDRIYVMNDGEITAHLMCESTDSHEILYHASHHDQAGRGAQGM